MKLLYNQFAALVVLLVDPVASEEQVRNRLDALKLFPDDPEKFELTAFSRLTVSPTVVISQV
jgi:hypothetical protein